VENASAKLHRLDRQRELEPVEHVNANGADALATDFFAGKAVLFDEGNFDAVTREQNSCDASCGAGSDDGDVGHEQEIRNPKLEIRNKSKISNSKSQNAVSFQTLVL